MAKPLLALQLYSLRREFEADPEATFRQVRGLGYENFEFAGAYGWTIDKWKAMLAETGLKAVGAHVGEHELANDLDKQVAFQSAIGNHRYIIPWIPDRTVEGFKRVAAFMNKTAPEVRQRGGELLYHNHDFEFAQIEGTTGFDILVNETDPALVKFEVDTFWVEFAGLKVVEFLKKYAKRIGTLHAKEIDLATRKDVAVGSGDIDWPAVLLLAQENNWPVIVEYEGEGAIEVCRKSAAFLNAKIAAM